MKSLCYYTCYFGGDNNYSKHIPPIPSEVNDVYFFTNNIDIFNKLENTKYKRIFMSNIPVYNDDILDTMSTKEIRSCPHHFQILNDLNI